MSNTKWTHVTTSVECLSQPKRIFPISPSKGLDEKNLFNTRRTSSSSFLSFQSVETPHHYSCDVFISPKVFLQKKQRETYLLQKMPKVWNAQPNFNIFSILWIHKKNYIFLCGHKISKDFYGSIKKSKSINYFFMDPQNDICFFLCCQKISNHFFMAA